MFGNLSDVWSSYMLAFTVHVLPLSLLFDVKLCFSSSVHGFFFFVFHDIGIDNKQ